MSTNEKQLRRFVPIYKPGKSHEHDADTYGWVCTLEQYGEMIEREQGHVPTLVMSLEDQSMAIGEKDWRIVFRELDSGRLVLVDENPIPKPWPRVRYYLLEFTNKLNIKCKT